MDSMINAVKSVGKHRWLMALRGVAGIVFGLLTFIWPLATIWALAMLWGLFALVDGALALGSVWSMHKKGANWWPYLLFGIVGLAAGILAIIWPGITAVFLLYIIGIWALLGGFSQLLAAMRLRKYMDGDWSMAVAGILGVALGALLLLAPLEGVLAVAMVIGFYALATGILCLVMAMKTRAPR